MPAWLVWLTAGQGLTFNAVRYQKLARRAMNEGPVLRRLFYEVCTKTTVAPWVAMENQPGWLKRSLTF